ncbi:MAG TPA: hypothetical protein VJZ71_01525 [Phycisphaerae bacterium]|nr:hypothetical protein [Phycisphaerae bacterium]
MRDRLGILTSTLALAAMTGCGTTDWQRDLLSALPGTPVIVPITLPGGPGPAGPAGPAGAPGAPGPAIIIARAVVNADGTLENSDDITAVRTAAGNYQLTIDLTGDTLPAGTTEDDFEVFLTLKEGTDLSDFSPLYIPISLAGTTLRVDVIIAAGQTGADNAFSVMVLLPAG